jgi:hypothetical protein
VAVAAGEDPNPEHHRDFDHLRLPSQDRSTSCSASNNTSCSELSDDMSVNDVEGSIPRKDDIVDRVMLKFYDIFTPAEYNSRTEHPSSASPKSSECNETTKKGSLNVSGSKRAQPDSQRNGDDANNDDQDDGHSRKRPCKSMSDRLGDPETRRLLACPYFKHNPKKYQTWRTCIGPGWDSVSRLKCVSR